VEEELDLRAYVAVLVKRWKLIVALTLVPAIIALAVSFTSPAVYEAVATVIATSREYRISLDAELESFVVSQVPAKAHSALAKNAELQEQTIAALGDTLPTELRSVEGLDKLCSVSSAGDPSVIQLKVRHTDPQVAADVANTWATLYVRQTNRFSCQSEDDVEQLDQQVEIAARSLHDAEQALIEFQETNPMTVLSATIKAQSGALADYMAATTSIQLAVQDAENLKQQLQATGTASPSLASNLSALLIELNALGVQRGQAPLIQVSVQGSGGGASVSEQLQHLDNLVSALEAKEQAFAVAMQDIPAKILEAQGELQRAQTEMDRLERTRTLAEEAYLVLSRKADELRIAAQLELGSARIASRAVVPVRPMSRGTMRNTAMAGVLGLMIAVFVAFATEYFKEPLQVPGEG